MKNKLTILTLALFFIFFSLSISFGQSQLGHWSTDKLGLPVFNYTGKIPYKVTAHDGHNITYPEDPWFLLGNYGITSFVHTSGTFDLYTLRRAWARLNVPTKNAPATHEKIKIDHQIYDITGLDSELARNAKKVFGTGFANFKMQITKDISCERNISIAPSPKMNKGIATVLVTVHLHNTSNRTKKIEYTESAIANYQMIGEFRINYQAIPKNTDEYVMASFEAHTDKTISKASKEEASTYDFYPPNLFLIAAGKATYQHFINEDNSISISAHHQFKLKAKQSKTISFVLGYQFDDENIIDMSNTIFTQATKDSNFRTAWKNKLPDYSYQKDEVIRREQYWNTYVLEASAKYNSYFDETFIPQGMTYDYVWGLNAVARDHLHYSLPSNYFNPQLSKSIIRFVLKGMLPNGYFNYNINGYGYSAPNLWNPSDLQLHLLWAVASYLNASKDYSFLKEITAYYPKKINYNASVIEKLTVAFDYLNDEISTGPHGLVKMLNADWNDQVWNDQPLTIYYPSAESHYNSSMAIVVLQQLVDELKKATNHPQLSKEKRVINSLIEKITIYRERILKAFIKDLGDRDFVKRAYYNNTLSMGDSSMHIESQLYTLMIDEIPLEQKQRIVTEVEKRLMNNERIGVRTSESKLSEVFEAGTHENGGIWQYIQGMYALGLLHVDKEKADQVIHKMSFHNFANQYPNYWPGQWTGADCVSSSLAEYPGLVSNNGSVYMNFPTYCAHIHAWPLLYQFKRRALEEGKE